MHNSFKTAGVTKVTPNIITPLSFEEFKIQIPKITPTLYFENKLIKQITSDKKAKASVLDRKSHSDSVGSASDSYSVGSKHNWCKNSLVFALIAT